MPASFKVPFSFNLSPITESSVHRITCPSDDESRGIVVLHWFGHTPDDILTAAALEVMFDYMSNTPIAPLQKDFILCPEPLASSAYFHISEQVSVMVIPITFLRLFHLFICNLAVFLWISWMK